MSDDNERKSQLLVHGPGRTLVTFSPNGHYMVTGGDEGYARVFDMRLEQTESELNNRLIDWHEEPITTVAASNTLVCTGSESGGVALHKVAVQQPEDGSKADDFVDLLTRCSFPIRSVKFDPKGKRVAVASDELIVKVIDAEDPTKIQLLSGHKKGVRQVTWSPDGALITTSTSDGVIRVWDVNNGEASCIQVLEDIVKAAEPEDLGSCEPVWHPSGKFFVVQSKSNELVVISRDTWQRTGAFAKDGHTDEVTALAFSDNGRYLVSAARDQTVLVWDVPERRVITRETHGKIITQIAFSSNRKGSNLACWTDDAGWLIRWNEPIPADLPAPAAPLHARAASVDSNAYKTISKPQANDSVATGAPSRSKPANGVEVDSDVDPEEQFDDGWLDDDDGLLHEAGVDHMDEDRSRSRKDKAIERWRDVDHTGNSAYSGTPTPKGQEPFQPSSTPLREQRRYLAFNMLGVISTVEREDHNLITIEFHDRSAHVGTHFNDSFRFSLGAMGQQGCAFACRASGDSPGQVYYRSYENWSTAQEWQYELLPKENPTVIAVGGVEAASIHDMSIAGSGTVIIATDKGYLRFLSGSGLQKYVWNIGQEVVTMAAGQEWVVVVHRNVGTVIDARQQLEYTLIDIDTLEVVQQGVLPLTKGTTLKWLPAIYDSNGSLSVLDRARRPRQARWVPTLETATLARRENKQESYWPVGVTAKHLHAIILKGEEKHPHFPTPVFQEIELQLPLLRLEVQQGQMEEKYIRETMFVTHRRDGAVPDDFELKASIARQEIETDKIVLLLVQNACKADKLEAALDAVLMLSQPASINAAAKIAAFYALPALEDRITLIQEAKTGVRKFEDDNKRDGKWAHLMDERTFVTATRHGGGAGGGNMFGGGGGGASRFTIESSMPPMSSFTPRPSSTLNRSRIKAAGDSSMSSTKRKVVNGTGTPMATADTGLDESWEQEDVGGDDSMNANEAPGDDSDGSRHAAVLSSPKRARSDSIEAESLPAQPKKATNPFAKRAHAQHASSPANPFAMKNKSGTKDLTRTGSFFNRVEGVEAPKAKGKGKHAAESQSSKGASLPRQTTLFGMAPPKQAAKPEAGRKRKTAAADGEDKDEDKSEGSKKLTSMSGKPTVKPAPELPREGEEFEESQMETQMETEMEETQLETQSTKPASLTTKGDDRSSDKENQVGATSKLAKYKMQASAVATVADDFNAAAAPVAADAVPVDETTDTNEEATQIEVAAAC
ncbi:DNA polymerase alpha accessory factor Mcl1 [Microbotryomycetes sp. JL221]|nr:DNA polymerase alpha accessory factor Mcl1 [Microbotryomycetes sp. JL221]